MYCSQLDRNNNIRLSIQILNRGVLTNDELCRHGIGETVLSVVMKLNRPLSICSSSPRNLPSFGNISWLRDNNS